MNDAGHLSSGPHVGIFWFVPTSPSGSSIISERTSLDAAIEYGNMLTHEGGHSEFWDLLAAMGAGRLRAEVWPTTPAFEEYDTFPRGRVVFDRRASTFIIYADRRLHHRNFRTVIENMFGLQGQQTRLMTDRHYSRSRAVPRPK